MSFERKSLSLLKEAIDELDSGFDQLPDFEPEVDQGRL